MMHSSRGAIRNTDDACINPVSFCDVPSLCPGNCASCNDDPCEGYIETGCSMTASESATSDAPENLEDCFNFATTQGTSATEQKDEANFFTFDKRAQICKATRMVVALVPAQLSSTLRR